MLVSAGTELQSWERGGGSMGTPGHLLSCLEKPQGCCRGCPGLVGVLPPPRNVPCSISSLLALGGCGGDAVPVPPGLTAPPLVPQP